MLEHPNENGMVIFVLGVLFILSVYHFLLYFQHKDKIYLYYSLYTSLIFITQIKNVESGFVSILATPILETLKSIHLDLIWIYNMLYFIFAFTFLDLKSFSLKWYKFIFRAIYVLCFICILSEISYRITGNTKIIFMNRHMFFMLYLSILGLISFVPLFKMNTPLKYYIIVGSIFLFGLSLISTFLHKLNIVPYENKINYSVFYIGVIIENILFSLGLGHKQKLILIEKNESQGQLIKQLQENQKLRHKIQEQFEQDVASLSKQAEAEKLEAVKAKYDKELTDLKMATLRSQMNPHFIFNSLNSIKRYIIDNEVENAVYYLNKFAKLIRKVLATTREKEILLVDEIETMELYISIENIRFNNEIDYSITIDENLNLDTIKIPSLILQPFIENAIWHGLSLKKEKKKLALVLKKDKKSHLKIEIIDNGIGRKKSAEIKEKKIHKRDSIGIKLTEERLSKFSEDYKNNYSITFKDLYDKNDNSKGTNVSIRIPLK